ncbi:MAG: hypothetical protein AAF871_00905 [Pseudomonadota bacterium]
MRFVILAMGLVLGGPAIADPATVEKVTARSTGGEWRFDVTIRHADTGWDDYADGWQVEAEDGTVLGYRELLHPHVNEQPFTRSLSGVAIPDGMAEVFIRARTNVDGWDEARTSFELGGG